MARRCNLFVAALAVSVAALGASSAGWADMLRDDSGFPGSGLHGEGFHSGSLHEGLGGFHDATGGRRWGYRHFNGRFGNGWASHGPGQP
jgi:hypothetical protein